MEWRRDPEMFWRYLARLSNLFVDVCAELNYPLSTRFEEAPQQSSAVPLKRATRGVQIVVNLL